MIRRWLMNFHVDVWSFYKPVLEHALKDWQNDVANIILGGVMVNGDRWQILRLSLPHGQRAILLGWWLCQGLGQEFESPRSGATPTGYLIMAF